ncbi:MAG: undecaprenyldiphospho-muramoylpentapeptide beta-N-acetylglucosaminyltransferase [Armatimonadota bacterium]|nr:undecaprenyldiphospho-muramoylpentapeptide beta-N-acetylglucosaminyltransferase [Armatimonadota bacterium]MDR7519264.1 undecaprenyldiphospho-muramoylpentapeptide beta-N-acetylglucosaminyltransferase [Armatimonadota bacterium]MDR7549750.1 undecaprenyldiphospho-muramoylpentapeptide beta-N-acetylglucosaminyltransferase [Armatimonadota bacterium]
MRVAIAAGGTGGHLFPGLAIAEALRRQSPGIEVMFIGGHRLESRLVPQEGWPFRTIAGRGLPSRPGWRTVAALASSTRGGWQALRLLWAWRPDVVVATGGYVCAPVGAAAVLLGLPLVLQEQNLSPGLANRVLARWARWVSVPHEDAASRWRARRVEVTGVPLRTRAVWGDRRRGMSRWGLEEGRVTVLVVGGSQGAHSLNRAVCRTADLLMDESGLQILHQTGPEHLHWVREAIGRREHVGPPALRHVAVPFLDPIGDAYAAADLVLCRAGASTLAEVTAWGLPAIVVPYPHAARAHQEENAAVLVRAGAAVPLADSDLDGTRLADLLGILVRDASRRAAMAAASRTLGRPGAADVVAGLVLALGPARAVQEVRA